MVWEWEWGSLLKRCLTSSGTKTPPLLQIPYSNALRGGKTPVQVATLPHPLCSLVNDFTFWVLIFTLNSKKKKKGHIWVYIRGTWQAAVHGVAESDTTSRLNDDSQRRAGTEWNGVCRVAARFWKPSINVPSLLTILILTAPIGSSPKHLFETYCVQIPCARCWRKELGWKCQLAKFIVFFLQACSPRNKITLQYLGHYNHTF